MPPYHIQLQAKNPAFEDSVLKKSFYSMTSRHCSSAAASAAACAQTNAKNKMPIQWVYLGDNRWTLSSISKDVVFIKVEGDQKRYILVPVSSAEDVRGFKF